MPERPRMQQLVARHRGDEAGLWDACLAHLPGVTGIGVTAVTRAGPQVRYTSDQVSAEIEQLQLRLDDGPCKQASRVGWPVGVGDLPAEAGRRWPVFTPAAVMAGARAVYSVPLQTGAARIGAVDLYRDAPGTLNHDELTDALVYADAATELLLTENPPVGPAADHRFPPQPAAIPRALSRVISQMRVPVGEAFRRLRDHARTVEQALPDVASALLSQPDLSGSSAAASTLLMAYVDATTAPAVRAAVRDRAARVGLDDIALTKFVLAVHEAVANAVNHGGGHGRLWLWLHADTLWCEITDDGPGIPADEPAPVYRRDTDRIGGRGLWLIKQTCTSLDIDSTSHGTRVLLSYSMSATATSTTSAT